MAMIKIIIHLRIIEDPLFGTKEATRIILNIIRTY